MKRKSIEFYMIVTNRSVYISDYCIKGLLHVINTLSVNYQVVLRIYLNCINTDKYEKYILKWKSYRNVEIIYSVLTSADFSLVNGIYKAINGKEYLYPMEFEEPFDRGYSNSEADYFISLDDDFEVLNPKLVIDMIHYMEDHPELPMLSTDRTIKNIFFDTYSGDDIILHERNDTWFIVFNNNYKINNVSCHPVDYYIKPNGVICNFRFGHDNWLEYIKACKQENGVRHVYDGTSWLQKEIRLKYPSEIISIKDVDPQYDSMYIHYGSFTQNRSVNTPERIRRYRFLSIREKIGFSIFPNSINKKVRVLFKLIFKIFFQKALNERKTESFESNLD